MCLPKLRCAVRGLVLEWRHAETKARQPHVFQDPSDGVWHHAACHPVLSDHAVGAHGHREGRGGLNRSFGQRAAHAGVR